jgi:hypothetical protein
MHWLTKQIEDMGFKSVMWEFGAPGHGKVSDAMIALFLLFSTVPTLSKGCVGRPWRDAETMDS